MNYKQLVHWSTIGYSLLVQRSMSYYYVLGHPKSGTGWLQRMLSTYLEVPRLALKRRWFPAFSPCVLKTHRFIAGKSAKERTLYIARDGRDVAVSYYWQVLRHGGKGRQRIEAWMGRKMTSENIRENLSRLVEYLQFGRISSIPYHQHVDKALNEGYVIVRYEDLLDRGELAFSQALYQLLGGVDEQQVKRTVAEHSFEAETGRPRGVEDPNSYRRKGVSGEWRKYFTRETAEVFDRHEGNALIRLGYERDHGWIESLEN